MRFVPENAEEKVQFFERLLVLWATNGEAAGLSADQLDEFTAHVADARAAVNAQRLAQQTARSATVGARGAIATLARSGSKAIQILRAVHERENIVSASLPAPRRTRTKLGPPGTPERFRAKLDSLGRITLTWRCEQPSNGGGTIYYVSRRLDGGPWVYLKTVGERRYVDDTIPAGTATATYQVQAARSTSRGPIGEFSVRLGVHPGMAALCKPRFRSAA